MIIPVWTGGVIVSLFFAYLAVLARRWWPLAYLLCIFFAAGTGLVFGVFRSSFVNVWWFLFLVFTIGFPIFRMTRDRLELQRQARERRVALDRLMVDLDRGDRASREGW